MYLRIYDTLEEFDIKTLKNDKNKSKIKALKKLGIHSLYDLVYFFPRTYENKAKHKPISELIDGENVIIEGKVLIINNAFFGKKKLIKVLFTDGEGLIELVWFNSPYILRVLEVGMELRITGKIRKSRNLQIINPSYSKINSSNRNIVLNEEDKLDSVYSLSSGIDQKNMKKIVEEVLKKYLFLFEENLPQKYIVENKLISRTEAIANIHFPRNNFMYEEAKKRILFEEALILEMKILKNRYNENIKNYNLYFLDDNKDLVKKYVSGLSFELTKDQKKIIAEIYKELNNGKIINRLIQGDVGSGKTIISLILLLYMAENNYQGVIMAPTEILATQHYLEVVKEFDKLNIRVELLTGSTRAKKKEEIYKNVENGNINISIGTHSLLEDNLKFNNLGLIIIDEQHKFGVDQRNKIRDKGIYSNLIVMTATPIPRSLALTIYGDLDVSLLTTMPLGRKPIKTKWIKNKEEENSMYEFIDKKIKEGRQVYVVSPLIVQSDKLNISSAVETYEKYCEKFPQYTVGLLHGKIKSKEKENIMNEFKEGRIDILVSTTVVEVGVNVPNSSIIVILNSERFGLSSLHQLRGRVGRGEHSSYCFLLSETQNEISQKRLQVMEETLDGFKIAEEDLKLRDTGEIFGIKQSGISELKLLDIVNDIQVILNAKKFSEEYLDKNLGLIKDKILKIDVDNLYENR
ncbi:DNA helicase RecG [Streptobacillus moniliformis]|uniref:ATP-dependent DNA helicase RecG n=1 Tax=Streptobacillus moniliformis (strain ATCC 14647 / DSM 12112 / NCTC 10651 / 9901) TaxID=519441 RepID=D1AV18_STRM9|nr:ATP-dependent DNA helicase RecG [Streptobacillus moniliformis]ACZ01578.1 ATP-dependent DNA helicase RecG [Streptobacillus moniliformis DSM 12112]AVL43427.1 DNA helicase RecG [Streptobacillus moniliformis]SQA13254.1 ATP-dependent DNA helicase recG [Streptobacillus moniliformis]